MTRDKLISRDKKCRAAKCVADRATLRYKCRELALENYELRAKLLRYENDSNRSNQI